MEETFGILPACAEVIIGVFLHHLPQVLRKRGETVNLDILGLGDDLAGEDKRKVNLRQRLAREVFSHIEFAAVEILPQSY